jgi:hypothetical protein
MQDKKKTSIIGKEEGKGRGGEIIQGKESRRVLQSARRRQVCKEIKTQPSVS